MAEFTPQRLLCLQCGSEVTTTPDMRACPECGDHEHIPANLDDSVTIRITNHELRILTIWADNWARHIEKTTPGAQRPIRIILDRLAVQTPVALTLGQEIADLAKEFGGVKVVNLDGEEIDLYGDGS